MNILVNGHQMLEEELPFSLYNRAFQYNDGFFETAIVQHGKVNFWPDHLERMQEAAQALKLNLPDSFTQDSFKEQLLALAEGNGASNYGRLKLKAWRAGAGLYTPEQHEAEWLATVQAAVAPATAPLQVGVCSSTQTIHSPLSFFKGPNALVYVMASIEKQEQGFGDMIILNQQGLVSELTASNIFWYINGEIYTPALNTGCVNGILRRNILRHMEEKGIKTHHTHCQVEDLYGADAVFSANVTGIRSIGQVQDKALTVASDFIDELRNSLLPS